ncbi:MAG: hypothetical protein WED10_12945 [Brumimicrobium sp.]
MKKYKLLLIIGFLIIGCKKDKVNDPIIEEDNYYQSSGNLLILKVSNKLGEAYEYNLASTELINDSLNIQVENNSDGLYQYSYWKYLPNSDTLFWRYSNNYTFSTASIEPEKLLQLESEIVLDTSLFQNIFNQSNIDYASLWSKVSNLEIVKTFRNASPNSKIGISRQVINEFDEELGFGVSKEIFILIFVK